MRFISITACLSATLTIAGCGDCTYTARDEVRAVTASMTLRQGTITWTIATVMGQDKDPVRLGENTPATDLSVGFIAAATNDGGATSGSQNLGFLLTVHAVTGAEEIDLDDDRAELDAGFPDLFSSPADTDPQHGIEGHLSLTDLTQSCWAPGGCALHAHGTFHFTASGEHDGVTTSLSSAGALSAADTTREITEACGSD
jgi:hypothetical protein